MKSLIMALIFSLPFPVFANPMLTHRSSSNEQLLVVSDDSIIDEAYLIDGTKIVNIKKGQILKLKKIEVIYLKNGSSLSLVDIEEHLVENKGRANQLGSKLITSERVERSGTDGGGG